MDGNLIGDFERVIKVEFPEYAIRIEYHVEYLKLIASIQRKGSDTRTYIQTDRLYGIDINDLMALGSMIREHILNDIFHLNPRTKRSRWLM